MSARLANRIDAAWRAAEQAGAGALLITNPANILYLSGFAGSSARLLIRRGRLYFITDFRYSRTVRGLQAAWPDGSQVVEISGSYDKATIDLVASSGPGKVAVEAGHVTLAQHQAWTSGLGNDRLLAIDGIVEGLRTIKDDAELATMREAGRRISGIAESLAAWVKPGRRERDIADDVTYAIARDGFSRPAFETIVA